MAKNFYEKEKIEQVFHNFDEFQLIKSFIIDH